MVVEIPPNTCPACASCSATCPRAAWYICPGYRFDIKPGLQNICANARFDIVSAVRIVAMAKAIIVEVILRIIR
jgi:MinD superfamily P-loop ATPase